MLVIALSVLTNIQPSELKKERPKRKVTFETATNNAAMEQTHCTRRDSDFIEPTEINHRAGEFERCAAVRGSD